MASTPITSVASVSHTHQRSPPRRVVLGIDPGLALTGYAVLSERRTGQPHLHACSVIRTPPRTSLAERLALLHEQLTHLLHEKQPTEAAVESLFFGRNRSTAMEVAHARGVILLVLQHAGVSIEEYTPTHVKHALTGRGNATKSEVGACVQAQLHLTEIPHPDDAADAAAIGLCHLTSSVTENIQNDRLTRNTRKRKK